MKSIIGKFNDAGPLFSYVIFALLLLIVALFVRALITKEYNGKLKSLIASVGWFALAWGYLGRTFGLIVGFDRVAAAGDISPSLLAEGLKMALLGPLFGLTTFLFARGFIIALILMRKKENEISNK